MFFKKYILVEICHVWVTGEQLRECQCVAFCNPLPFVQWAVRSVN